MRTFEEILELFTISDPENILDYPFVMEVDIQWNI